jgi:outer membrane protease
MKSTTASILALSLIVAAAPAAAQEEKKEKKKAEKVSGDVGLLDLDKNYMILVTKEGKLVTLDFDKKTKVTMLKEEPAKMGDIGLGSSATIEYTQKGEKNFLKSIEFVPAKGGE